MSDGDLRQRPRHPIRVAARRAGLTPSALRAWERRYGAVSPSRGDTGRRLYSDLEIERLRLLQELTRAGRRIGDLVDLPPEELAALLEEERGAAAPETPADPGTTDLFLAACLDAVQRMDASGLHSALMRAAVELGPDRFVGTAVLPLLHEIGVRWERNQLRPGDEHFASAGIRQALGWLLETLRPGTTPSALVATTPAGERHEFGALLAATTAASAGWTAVYLGPDLPADDIAAICERVGARVVALSLVYPPAGGLSPVAELRRLRAILPREVAVVVGGRAADWFRRPLEEAGIELLPDLPSLRRRLDSLAADAPPQPR